MHYTFKDTYIPIYITLKCKRNINPKFHIAVTYNGKQDESSEGVYPGNFSELS